MWSRNRLFPTLGVVVLLASATTFAGEGRSGCHVSAGLIGSSERYTQNAPSVLVTDKSLSGSLALSCEIVPATWLVDVGAFRTIDILSHTPAPTQKAHFQEFDGSLALLLHSSQSLRVQLGGGVDVWSALVSGKAYGVNLATGPEAVLGLYFIRKSGRTIGLRLRGVDFVGGSTSRRYSAEALYELLHSQKAWQLYLVADYSNTRVTDSNGVRFSDRATSVGFQIRH